MQTIYWTVCTLALEGKREMLLQEQEYQQEKQTLTESCCVVR